MKSSRIISLPIFLEFIIFLVIASWSSNISKAKAIDTLYKDPNQGLDVRIKSLLGQMSLEEKIGQMAQIERSMATAEIMRKLSIGSILSGPSIVPREHATPEEWVDMVNNLQNGSLSSRLGIPMIYGIDAIRGHNTVYNATILPHNIGLGATRDPELVKRIGAATALEVRATGITYVFAPCVAVCRDPRWGRCYESYSEDPEIVKEMTEIIYGLQGETIFPPNSTRKGVPYIGGKDKVVAAAKHYVGDGGTANGRNEGNTVANWDDLLSIHMPGYYHSILKGVSSIMISYSSLNGVKMHANQYLITSFLKGTLRFRGFVISDFNGVDKITDPQHANYSDSLLKAINAGIDMVMGISNYTEFRDILVCHVKNNLIPMRRIDDAVKRILRIKFILGIFELEPIS